MTKPSFVKFEVPSDLVSKVYEAITLASKTGKLRKGVNESTKSIERGNAKLVIMAEDVTPEEILIHLPILCREKKIPFVYVPSKIELGKAAGIEVPTSSISIVEEGESKKVLADVVHKIEALKK
ncbi:MAG: 50S ribosomal protein L7Ae [Candidatus Aenigmatarchaeota archaeon]|nr:50S ribosomal protein L7Ae [Nanoarchaeota archaeon]